MESYFLSLPERPKAATYTTAWYEYVAGSSNKINTLGYYQRLESRLKEQQSVLSRVTFNFPNKEGAYAFLTEFENIKNLCNSIRLTVRAQRKGALAFFARHLSTAIARDETSGLTDDEGVASRARAHSQEIRAALEGEKAQYDEALSRWKKARKACEKGLAAATRYDEQGIGQRKWLSKEEWINSFQHIIYRTTELQYWRSQTMQKIFENDLRSMNERGNELVLKKLPTQSELHAQRETTYSQFSEVILECYKLFNAIVNIGSYNADRIPNMYLMNSPNDIISRDEIYKRVVQHIKLACDTF